MIEWEVRTFDEVIKLLFGTPREKKYIVLSVEELECAKGLLLGVMGLIDYQIEQLKYPNMEDATIITFTSEEGQRNK